MMSSPIISVFTATYNRRDVLHNVYKCLCRQTYKAFEWIVVDDGSSDNTGLDLELWIKEKKVDIRYFYQSNNGKHIAMNKALMEARGEYFVNIDSDDVMRDDALEVFVNAWDSIPEDERHEYMSVKAKCYNPDTHEVIGEAIPNGRLTSTVLDAKYRLKMNYEMWSMVKTSIRRKYLNPDIRGGKNGGLRFYPEGIWQDLASKKYKTLFIDKPLRGYSQNTSTSLMGYGAKYDRSRENIYLWTHIVNNNSRYFWNDPVNILKAYIGVSMDSFFLNYSVSNMLRCVRGMLRKVMVFMLIPIGYICYLKRR